MDGSRGNKWTWPCPNKTLFTKMNVGPNLTCGPLADPVLSDHLWGQPSSFGLSGPGYCLS